MRPNRAFLPQQTVDAWLSDGKIELNGTIMSVPAHARGFLLESAIYIVEDVGGAGDQPQLLGKVKDLAQIAELGGEHCADSLIVEDDAYRVVEGFVATLVRNPIEAAGGGVEVRGVDVPDDELHGGDAPDDDELAQLFEVS
ncbi:MAG: hypothetical protein MJD61_20665 [Proteobacteria bacterium]|nr:hypothetical protein [Pseudomonadota bacterium]